jgi:glycogen phosphorylase
MPKPIYTYTVKPSIPDPLKNLELLAYNFLWGWDHQLMDVFMRLDLDLWEKTDHNPVKMLGTVSQDRLNNLAEDDAFLAQLERATHRFNDYMESKASWFTKNNPQTSNFLVAYFSAEFGITECLKIYSGGLGMLAGDHLKSSSDLGIPLVAMGLLYQHGYFHQYLNADGWQQERYDESDFFTLPLKLLRDAKGEPLIVGIDLPGRKVSAQIWLAQVGRVVLYLLDTNIPTNSIEDRKITGQLYGGDREMRMMQEILLGIGGYRALKLIGLSPTIYHLNEGHSAFLILERCRDLIETNKLSFNQAREAATASCVFTTHTPVAAGNDYFVPELVEKYFSGYYKNLGLDYKSFLGLGRVDPDDDKELYCMTVLALRMSGASNGVSKLHGAVSREMWQELWPEAPLSEIPIRAVTNGAHAPYWMSIDMAHLLDRYLSPGWRIDPGSYGEWNRVRQIPELELWRTHELRRERLVAFTRNQLAKQLEARGAAPTDIARAKTVLQPDALTIGFGRRFATYKRATLLFRNIDRLLKIITDKDHPVQIIYAGKAHPADTPGKELIRNIIHFERNPDIRKRMVFLEDYDMRIARYMVQGADIWLNTPCRPMEASGTSGMKAALNGALNVSVLDGWWPEAYTPETGWAIGRGEDYEDEDYQDDVESNALYDLLEKEIIPLFYNRTDDDVPHMWVEKMKNSMRRVSSQFNTNRMVGQYAEEMYFAAHNRYTVISSHQFKPAKEFAQWKEHLQNNWGKVKIVDVKVEDHTEAKVGATIKVRASIDLGNLKPEDVRVELYFGKLNADGNFDGAKTITMEFAKKGEGKIPEFIANLTLEASGRVGHTVRVVPRHEGLDNSFSLSYMLWA